MLSFRTRMRAGNNYGRVRNPMRQTGLEYMANRVSPHTPLLAIVCLFETTGSISIANATHYLPRRLLQQPGR